MQSSTTYATEHISSQAGSYGRSRREKIWHEPSRQIRLHRRDLVSFLRQRTAFWHFTQKWAFAYASIKTTFQSCEHKRLTTKGGGRVQLSILVLTHFKLWKQVKWNDGVGKGHSHCKNASDMRAYESMVFGILTVSNFYLRRCQRVATVTMSQHWVLALPTPHPKS